MTHILVAPSLAAAILGSAPAEPVSSAPSATAPVGESPAQPPPSAPQPASTQPTSTPIGASTPASPAVDTTSSAVDAAAPVAAHDPGPPPAASEPVPSPGASEPGPTSDKPEVEAVGWSMGAFVDGYAGANWAFPRPQTGQNVGRAFDVSNGFGLAWAGVDLGYAGKVAAGTASLRFGPSALLVTGDTEHMGLNVVKQGYGTWMPATANGKLAFDLGKFDTLYGAEVAESQGNMNYTRGVLNWLGQPLHHTGLRASWSPVDTFGLTAMVANGWNNSLDNNAGKSYGVQFAVTPAPAVSIYLGYLTGPEGDEHMVIECDADSSLDEDTGACVMDPGAAADAFDVEVEGANAAFRHFADLVVDISAGERLSFLLNGDVGLDPVLDGPVGGDTTSMLWWGAMASARRSFGDHWAAALRGEYYHDRDDYTAGTGEDGPIQIGTGTLTLEFSPASEIILKLDNRIDVANVDMFPASGGGAGSTQFTTTLGVVVRTE